MATTIRNQVESINAAAAHFALQGYHVNTTISIDSGSAQCTIYFDNYLRKNFIIKSLRCFKDENDTMEFNEFRTEQGRKLHTLTLTKEVTL